MKHSTSIVLVVVGVALLIAAVQIVHFGNQPEFYHSISPGPDSETALNASLDEYGDAVTREEVLVEYSDLPASGQRIVRERMAAEGRELRLRGAGNGIPGLEYGGDAIGLGQGRFFLAYEGEYYVLDAYGDDGFSGLFELMTGLVLFGIAVPTVLGGLASSDELAATASALTALTVVTSLSVVGFGWFGVTGLAELLALGLLAGAVSAAIAWLSVRTIVGRVERSLPSERHLRRRLGMAGMIGGGALLVTLLVAIGHLAPLELLDVTMVLFLTFAIPAAVAWHGFDGVVHRTLRRTVRER